MSGPIVPFCRCLSPVSDSSARETILDNGDWQLVYGERVPIVR